MLLPGARIASMRRGWVILVLLLKPMLADKRARALNAAIKLPTTKAWLEIRESSIPGAGLGVFLSSESEGPVPAGTLMTIYGDQNVHTADLEDNEYGMYNPQRPDRSRLGRPWAGRVPSKVEAKDKVGHIINDGDSISIPRSDRGGPLLGIEGFRRRVKEYEVTSAARGNVGFPGHGMAGKMWEMRAMREIQPGEELFWSYGVQYWLHRIGMTSEDPLALLLVYLYTVEQQAMEGDYLYVDAQGRPRMASSGKEVSDQHCRQFLLDFMHFDGRVGRAALARAGWESRLGYKDALRRLVTLVTTPDQIETPESISKAIAIMDEPETAERVRLPTATAWLEVRPSSIPNSGLGVFLAPKSAVVKEGTVVTIYGTHTLPSTEARDDTYSLILPERPGVSRVGEPWTGEVPTTVKAGVAVGHIANDAAMIVPSDLLALGEARFMGKPQLERAMEAYEDASVAQRNVIVDRASAEGEWDMIATRDIQPGEELFHSYGPEYWKAKALRALDLGKDPLTRLSMYLYTAEHEPERHPQGYIYLDHKGRPLLSTTGELLSEERSRDFLIQAMGFQGQDGKKAKAPGMNHREAVATLISFVGAGGRMPSPKKKTVSVAVE